MIHLGIVNPTWMDTLTRLARVASAYGATFFVIGSASGLTIPEGTLRFDTLEEAQRELSGDWVRITPNQGKDMTEFLIPEEAVYVLGCRSEAITAIHVGTPMNEPLDDVSAAAVVLQDAVFAGAGARELAKALGLLSA